jgi:hypothetical protein
MFIITNFRTYGMMFHYNFLVLTNPNYLFVLGYVVKLLHLFTFFQNVL